MEVQAHGVQFEDEIIFRITGKRKTEYQLLLEDSYTASFDIVRGQLDDRVIEKNYSIKTSGSNSIGCADILRFYKNCREIEFTMILGCWRQISKTHKVYNEIYELEFSPKIFPIIWSNISETELKEFVSYVKSIPSGKSAQITNKNLWKQKREEIYSNGRGLVSIDAKIDSKSQRRVQCSLKLSDLIANGISHVKYTTEYKEIKLPYAQESGKRTFS